MYLRIQFAFVKGSGFFTFSKKVKIVVPYCWCMGDIWFINKSKAAKFYFVHFLTFLLDIFFFYRPYSTERDFLNF
jgi:hypothetical protein